MQNKTVLFENDKVSLRLRLKNGCIYTDEVQNKQSGYRFKNDLIDLPLFNLPSFDMSKATLQISEYLDDRHGLSEEAKVMKLLFDDGSRKVCVELRAYRNNPFIRVSLALCGRFGGDAVQSRALNNSGIESLPQGEMSIADTIFNCPISERHLKVKTVSLCDVTDINNDLVHESNGTVYPHLPFTAKGQLFLLDAYLAGEAMLIAKEAPSAAGRVVDSACDLCINPESSISVIGLGVDFTKEADYTFDTPLFDVSFAVGEKGELERAWRDYYRLDIKHTLDGGALSSSNTWGDRNQDAAVCEEFILNEISCGKALGVNVVQVDDGWQKGRSANSAIAKSELWGAGYYDSDPEYWSLDLTKFPNGLAPVSEAAANADIKLGLWFSPDFANKYKGWQKDAQTLIALHKKYGISVFKIDGVNLTDKLTEERLAAMIDRVYRESCGAVSFNFDITAQRRWGYFYKREYGNLFVENRYTDFANYFPHLTLRNLWQLCRYVPAARLQMEFLNLRRNADKYGQDILAPNNYGIDYAYATVMFACPLYWFEMSNLSADDREALAKIASVRSRIAPDLRYADVTPIGNEPDGIAFTGLRADCTDFGYLLLFRESGTDSTYCFETPEVKGKKLTPLAGEGRAEMHGDKLCFTAEKPRSFLLLKYED